MLMVLSVMPCSQVWAWYGAPPMLAAPYQGYSSAYLPPQYWAAAPARTWPQTPTWYGMYPGTYPGMPQQPWPPTAPEWKVYGEMDALGNYTLYIRYRGSVFAINNR